MTINDDLAAIAQRQRQHPSGQLDLELVGIDVPELLFEVMQLVLRDFVELS